MQVFGGCHMEAMQRYPEVSLSQFTYLKACMESKGYVLPQVDIVLPDHEDCTPGAEPRLKAACYAEATAK
jgi:hypothetical protein